MRLLRVTLENFRQHPDTQLELRSGLTGIIGPNGSGKTTILEAIAWAIYGTQAIRGTKDTLRFNRAPGRSLVRAELEFELRGERLRVVRSPKTAELYRSETPEPIAAGTTEVTRQLTRRLGMTRREFYNTYFTGQKQLQVLAGMGPTDRARFLSQVLGYERLRAAQDLVGGQRKVLRGQVEELTRALGDREKLEADREAAEERLKDANAALGAAETRSGEAAAGFADVEPLWTELQEKRERHQDLSGELRILGTRLERVIKDEKETEAELARLADAAGELERLRAEAAPLSALREEESKLRELADAEARRQALTRQLEEQRERVVALSKRIAEQEKNARDRDELKEKLAEQEAECERLEKKREEAAASWQRDKQEVNAQLRILLDQAKELEEQIEGLEKEGPDGTCPTCRRPLGAEYEEVLTLVRNQYEEVVQDGKWYRKREKQLESEPAEVAEARERLARSRQGLERLVSKLADAESALAQTASLKSELGAEEERARKLAGAVAALPDGYDADRHAEVRRGIERLSELEKKITQLETRLERRPQLRSEMAEAQEEERQIRAQIEELEASREGLAFSEEEYREVGAKFEAARVTLEAARLDVERARTELEGARAGAEAARMAEKEHRQLEASITAREKELRLHNDLYRALGELRHELNDRVRPELSEIASVFLAELTDGRYNRLEIGPDYDVVVLDEGDEKPVISGGEEDLANLVLRLAISQMIADRAGQTLSLLIFDEVFGGLDDQRRESVVRLLQRLQDRFEQVILITHIESIRDGMDQVVRVAYEESTGASVVRDESPDASAGEPELEDLALTT
ncbi:MAG: SMC family ATPase [Gemmatimonadetes bacterium]|uniref:SMC family ATPase n=1 Tax=Candidatus Kutchimonas denitrificans TaxID=3056748 RepID=A0AAE4ZC16_9BACT|nr:SMC family ATPase [Gemmatimonadota bacterium]NIR76281.1 SMC family ATPase [Candidatus Kutchimonas denitrificans]NIS02304.1 SMC family ATPase [Gemmatimonadota bacterium]NIT68123.1 SMC family ATPase [Gemmatimonadota bacterium]NIU54347.1 AAA family ATPase [Gemmatimonadota bacterium]